MNSLNIGYALCGSFCTVEKSILQMEALAKLGANIIPIMSPAVYNIDSRFGKAVERRKRVEEITGNKIIHEINTAEPIGPKSLLDILIVSPCTGNTVSKISMGITDTSVTMAAKAQLRNQRPVLLAIATNDALSGAAQSIGKVLNTKNIYFVPFGQDDCVKKPTSMICDFSKLIPAAKEALNGKQIQPILV